jgi:antitoxin MazE
VPSKIALWGHSLGVRLPRYVVERTGIQRGDLAYVFLNASGDIVIRAVKPRPVHPAYELNNTSTLSDCPSREEVQQKW